MIDVNEIIGIARKARPLVARDELQHLCALAETAPDGMGVEIGVFCGASLIAWSLVREGRGASIGVDNFSLSNMTGGIDNVKAVCEKNLTASGAPATLIDGDSVEVAQRLPDDLAFVFIDGDHASPAVDNDIAAWTPKIRRGGIVAFHDYGRTKVKFDVTRAVDTWQAKDRWKNCGTVGTLIGYRRP